MFGLTKREQRWKAEKEVVNAVFGLTATALNAAAQIRVAEAKADTDELERLRAENSELRRLLARYRNETPLCHQPHMIAREADAALGSNAELTGVGTASG